MDAFVTEIANADAGLAAVISGAQCRAARGFLGINQTELAELAGGIARSVIVAFENGNRVPIANNMQRIQAELEARGCKFGLTPEGEEFVAFSVQAKPERTDDA